MGAWFFSADILLILRIRWPPDSYDLPHTRHNSAAFVCHILCQPCQWPPRVQADCQIPYAAQLRTRPDVICQSDRRQYQTNLETPDGRWWLLLLSGHNLRQPLSFPVADIRLRQVCCSREELTGVESGGVQGGMVSAHSSSSSSVQKHG